MNLKTAYEPYFKIGAAISRWNLHTAAHTKFLTEQFNSFTCENDMKPMYFLDTEECKKDPEKYNLSPALCFDNAIPYLEFAKENKIAMRGHTLAWHNQTPKWFFCQHYNENFPFADRETILSRLENYIKGVLEFVQTNYPGVIYAWDVFNEIVDEGDFRKSIWLQTVGKDFFIKAFEYARKYAAPGVDLFYNDYETALVWKRDFIIENVLKPLMEKGLVDGMGMQSHLLMDHPDLGEYRTALEMYGALGLKINITELDMHNADPSDESMHALAQRYKEVFQIYVDAKKSGKANITSVTFWNLLDENSWLSGFRRETSYPLLFKGKCEAKEAYYAVMEVVVPKEGIDKWQADYPEEDYLCKGMPQPEIKRFRENIWEDGEYTYEASYGFTPNIFAYLHNDDVARDLMLVIPGGGYCMCCPHEGELAAMEFFNRGMNAVVLSYTTDITMSVPLKKQPLKDISRAVRYIRKNSGKFALDGRKLVIMGFSAGSHVCGSLAVHFDDVKDSNPEYANVSNRPDGVILSYPVITSGKYTHEGSMISLLGHDASKEDLEYFSLEKQVKENTPPCFLWQTQEDDVVPVENSYLFANALREKKIPFAHYVFPRGSHGLTVANDTFFSGWSGGEYSMEQTMRAAFSVKEDKGVNVSEQRKQELIDQFFGGNEQTPNGIDMSLKKDVGLWTDLAWAWISKLQ
ncbi:endo-1,4-beta-xylanase [Butyrivibrio sp. VCB2006]|uniref:endo-1,4-beta-xylanase n=1 Tax=Butyrivibrio sp. VCB2006 TaxID=1280679 RepID=UPI000400C42C|nr:endo-1,4-beta-xylanase [Butyrivibrio sp. VCB2006]